MKKIPLIPTRVHGMLDLVTAGAFCVMPAMFGATKVGRRIMYGMAAVTLAADALTRFEPGIFKKLPMRAHLGIDIATGTLICSATLMHKHASSRAITLGMGLWQIGIALLTEQRSPEEIGPEMRISSPDVALQSLYHRMAERVRSRM